MPHNRFYIDSSLEKNVQLQLVDEEYHHLAHVLRTKEGEIVELVDGRGTLALAKVLQLKKRHAELLPIEIIITQNPPSPLILAQAIARMNHLDWIIEKGTELGVTDFWLFPGTLSEKSILSDKQILRLKTLTISAMKQCGRLDLPKIHLLPPLSKWTPLQTGTFFFGDTAKSAPYLWDLEVTKPCASPIILCIGPEKGLDANERTFLLVELRATGLRLHKNILRTETAGIVGLSLLQQFL